MAIAMKLKDYLEHEHIPYSVVTHPYSATSMQAAEEAHIPGDKLAKAVLLHDNGGYVVAVVPATHKVKLGKLRNLYGRYFALASEDEIHQVFDDCSIGALPPVGKAYAAEVIVDDALDRNEDIYFEAGDHTSLVHVSRDDFHALMRGAPHDSISRHI